MVFFINVSWIAIGVYFLITGLCNDQPSEVKNFMWSFLSICSQIFTKINDRKRNPTYNFDVERDFLSFDEYNVTLDGHGAFVYNYNRGNNDFRTPYYGYNFELNEVDNDNSIPIPLAIEVLTDGSGLKLEIKNPTLLICSGYQRDAEVYHKDAFLAVIEDVIGNKCKYLVRVNLCCNDEQYEKLRNLECYLGLCIDYTSEEKNKYQKYVILKLLANIHVGCCYLNQIKMFDSKKIYLRELTQLEMTM